MAPWKKKCRIIEREYENHYFKPQGIPLSKLAKVTLGHDELEAMRLVDLEHQRQSDAAIQMNISAATIQRMVEAAREKVTRALIEGHAIEIEGGDYQVKKDQN